MRTHCPLLFDVFSTRFYGDVYEPLQNGRTLGTFMFFVFLHTSHFKRKAMAREKAKEFANTRIDPPYYHLSE